MMWAASRHSHLHGCSAAPSRRIRPERHHLRGRLSVVRNAVPENKIRKTLGGSRLPRPDRPFGPLRFAPSRCGQAGQALGCARARPRRRGCGGSGEQWCRIRHGNARRADTLRGRTARSTQGASRCAPTRGRTAIVITKANDLMRPVHDRMPVVLPEDLQDLTRTASTN